MAPGATAHFAPSVATALDIRPYILEKAVENWTFRIRYIRASSGSGIPEIIFKKEWS